MTSTFYMTTCALLSVAALLGISMMSKVKTAVAGNLLSGVSVFLGIAFTLVFKNILSAWSIFIFIFVGIVVGAALAARVKMIQMPQFVALLNGLGGFASALVGILTLLGIGIVSLLYPIFVNVTSLLAIVIGLVTFTGSLVAVGKLHHLLPQKPIIWKYHTGILNISLLALIAVTFFVAFAGSNPSELTIAIILTVGIVVSILFGIAFAIRVGGADMPITISLLNSLTGIGCAMAGMAVSDLLLVSIGAIVGAAGLILTRVMCRAMNRQLKDILTGKTATLLSKKTLDPEIAILSGQIPATETIDNTEGSTEQVYSGFVETSVEILSAAKSVIIVPGYGMALAQAQHLVRQLGDKLEEKGAEVRYAIHPVAGRMPGHMNVLLAEADVPYEKLFEMDAVNNDFVTTDAVLVIGANDVINPAARDATDTPIYGMPVLNVDQAKQVIICNYDLNPGYSGVENPLYTKKIGVHLLLGDAKESLSSLLEGMS